MLNADQRLHNTCTKLRHGTCSNILYCFPDVIATKNISFENPDQISRNETSNVAIEFGALLLEFLIVEFHGYSHVGNRGCSCVSLDNTNNTPSSFNSRLIVYTRL